MAKIGDINGARGREGDDFAGTTTPAKLGARRGEISRSADFSTHRWVSGLGRRRGAKYLGNPARFRRDFNEIGNVRENERYCLPWYCELRLNMAFLRLVGNPRTRSFPPVLGESNRDEVAAVYRNFGGKKGEMGNAGAFFAKFYSFWVNFGICWNTAGATYVRHGARAGKFEIGVRGKVFWS